MNYELNKIELLHKFVAYLTTRVVSTLTIRNYRADIGAFIRWYEYVTKKSFLPGDITVAHVTYYSRRTDLAVATRNRHLSALRKFFYYCNEQQILSEELKKSLQKEVTPESEHIKAFTFYLFVQKSSELTIKQYTLDISQFLRWAKKTVGIRSEKNEDLFIHVNETMIKEYAVYLKNEKQIAQTTMHRKNAALNKYFSWLQMSVAVT